ncbi:MAG: hypothetical protein Q7S64_01510 [bacterium]|nr:hypothetical protein [bacterium]
MWSLIGLAVVLAVALVGVLWSVFAGRPATKRKDDIIEAEFVSARQGGLTTGRYDVDTYA